MIFSSTVNNLLMQNNIFYQPRRCAINMGNTSLNKTNITVRNNITDVGTLMGNGSGGINTCRATLSNNSLNTNPLMVDPTGKNYQLKSNSPAIDRGYASAAPPYDFADNSRPYNSGYDIGAYELSLYKSTNSQEVIFNPLPSNGIMDNGSQWTSSTGTWLPSGGANPYGGGSLYSNESGAHL